MGALSIHRELLLPPPTEEHPPLLPLVWNFADPLWIEVHRELDGHIRYIVGSESTRDLDAFLTLLEGTRSRIGAGQPVRCPALRLGSRSLFAFARPARVSHFFPIGIPTKSDFGGLLVRTLSSPPFRGHEAVLQVLFRRVAGWETPFFSHRFDAVARGQERTLRARMEARHAEPAYHVELRVGIKGPNPSRAMNGLGVWLGQITTPAGGPWRSWARPRARDPGTVFGAFLGHDPRRLPSNRRRRDVSGTELSQLVGIPWADRHPECSYAGAPAGRAAPDLRLSASTACLGRFWGGRVADPRLAVGTVNSQRVGLPAKWNHLALLGRTQSGKSTLAQNLVLQILDGQPEATVVVIEPTGTLIEGIVARLPPTLASDTIEIDPARSTFDREGTKMVSVPLSLLHSPDAGASSSSTADQRSESLAGNLILAIRNAWGEESIGGRAELVLRALVQGLAPTPRSNLVDAYHILSSKPALQRFVQTAPPGPLRDFLERHLPRLGYDFTMSSLDKVGKVATNPLLRVALCQRAEPVSFDRLLSHRLLLLNLSKSALGADGANFLGAIYLTQLWAALQRVGRPDRPVYLALDEVHNYAIPTLADMLSEGAKYGLHVIAATQYLHRVPLKVRAAMIGNVDAWPLFQLGVEDMDDAWKISNAESHGWVPQDLVDGLRPHEVALAVSGSLVKLQTLPSTPLTTAWGDRHAVVRESSRRYAQPEDSEASPWLVGLEDTERVLGAIGSRPRTRAELLADAVMAAPQLDAVLSRSTSSGDTEGLAPGATIRLTGRGTVHLRALQTRRNEGEEHIDTLVDFAMFLQARGILLAVPEQMAGVLTPDAQFRWGGDTYNVEVESSTITKSPAQVIRNVRKALAAGFRVLVVLPDRGDLPRAVAALEEAFPAFRPWMGGVGIVWRGGSDSFHPHSPSGSVIWPFLEDGYQNRSATPILPPTTVPPVVVPTDPLVDALRAAIAGLLAVGKVEATTQELLHALPPGMRAGVTEQQVGIALHTLGIARRRIRIGDTRIRLFDLASVGIRGNPAGPNDPSQPGEPTLVTDPGAEAGQVEVGPATRSDSPSTVARPTGPADADSPTD